MQKTKIMNRTTINGENVKKCALHLPGSHIFTPWSHQQSGPMLRNFFPAKLRKQLLMLYVSACFILYICSHGIVKMVMMRSVFRINDWNGMERTWKWDKTMQMSTRTSSSTTTSRSTWKHGDNNNYERKTQEKSIRKKWTQNENNN